LLDVKGAFSYLGIKFNDLYNFACSVPETPFPKTIPEYPIKKNKHILIPNYNYSIEPFNYPSYIPNFLPPFPEKHTYLNTPVFSEISSDPKAIKKLKNKEKRSLELQLAKLNEKLGNRPIFNYDTEKLKSNPYFQSPKKKNSKEEKKDLSTNVELTSTATLIPPTFPQYDLSSIKINLEKRKNIHNIEEKETKSVG